VQVLILILAGSVLTFLSFPNWNFDFLAWICLVPIFLATHNLPFKKSFFVGWSSGTLSFIAILYWIVPTFKAAGLNPIFGLLTLSLLASYIGLYYAFYFALTGHFLKNLSEFRSLLFCSTLWISLEQIRNYCLTGFPWGLLGYSQWQKPSFIQIAEFTGVYGVSFLIVFFNALIFLWIKNKRIGYFSALFFLSLFSTNFFILSLKKNSIPKNTKHFSVVLLQGNIDQYKKWDSAFINEILNTYKNLTESASQNSQLMIWPETSAPGWIPNDAWLMERLKQIISPTKTFHLIGAVTNQNKNYNSAFLFNPKGEILARVDKSHLVPFGEFVPMHDFLEKWIKVLNQLGGFDTGKETNLLKLGEFPLGISICYEAIFPNLIRQQTLKGAEVLINITNDGWYLRTAALPQHFSMNIFRAIENRRTLIRCANTGISGVIKPSGVISKKSEPNKQEILEDVVDLSSQITFYTRVGDLFAWLCNFASLLTIFIYKKNRCSTH